MSRQELLVRLGLAAVLTPVIKVGCGMFDLHPAWWVAAVAAVVLVFLGDFVIELLVGGD